MPSGGRLRQRRHPVEAALAALGADERHEGAGCLLARHEIRFPTALVAEAAVRVLIGQQRVEHAVAVLYEAAVIRIKAQRVERKDSTDQYNR